MMLYYIFILTTIHNVKSCFIQNKHNPICANCKFFTPIKNECRLFGETNLITGEYRYEDAVDVRNNKEKCGKYAIFLKKIISNS